ncbi:MAG: hypothetical protein LBF68_07280 [Christensenellaceae bacterium]|jgi:hypothetical protein|nr:hypothetical protein [Christensenellaceae bacterium]
MDANRFNHITVTNQNELDEFLNGTTVNKSDYCLDIRSDEPLVVETSEVRYFNIHDNSIVTFLNTFDMTFINAYNNSVAIIESENNEESVVGHDNSTIINRNKFKGFECILCSKAKFKDESLNPDIASKIDLKIVYISTQEKLDECVKLYQNLKNVTFCIYHKEELDLVVNQKINGRFDLDSWSRVVFKKPTNSDNKSIDYYIHAGYLSTAIIETNNCAIRATSQSRIVKRCKDDIVNLYIKEHAKLVDESHLLDTNKHKETSKGRCK